MIRSLPIVLSFLLAAISWADGPATLPNRDPLLRPAPKLDAALKVVADARPADEKIVPSLRLALAKADEMVKVVVSLNEPVLPPELAAASYADRSGRASYVAALEHSFVEAAASFGFVARRGMQHLPVVAGTMPADRVTELAALVEVRWVELDFELRALRSEGGALIDAPELRALGGSGSGIGVAILDTGIDWSHAELAGSKVTAAGDYTGTQLANYGFDDNGHGTACAGIVAGTAGGMAPQAHLWALKVLDAEGSGDFSHTVAALDDIYDNLGNYGGVRVVSASLGAGAPIDYVCDGEMPSMTAAMNLLVGQGVAIFVASGNDGCSNGIGFPACVSHAISVGAVYDANMGGVGWGEGECTPSGCTDMSTAADKITCFSNSGTQLDLLAPSYACQTPALGGGYWGAAHPEGYFSGTSAACPYAAGVAAQITSLRPSTTVAELRTALKTTGRSITDSRNGIARKRIEADAAYQYLTGGGGGGGGGGASGECDAQVSVLYLQNGRFRISGAAFSNNAPSTFFLQNLCAGDQISNTAAAFFFNDITAPVQEGFVSVRDICNGGAQAFVVEVASASTRRFWIDVTDTWKGISHRYENPWGGSSSFFPADRVSFRDSCD